MINVHNLNIAKLVKTGSYFSPDVIEVTPESTTVTDGHILVTVTTPKAGLEDYPAIPGTPGPPTRGFKPFKLAAKEAAAIAKAIPKNAKTHHPILCNAVVYTEGKKGNPVSVGVSDLAQHRVFPIQEYDGSFPDWRRVMPRESEAIFTIALDARSVRDIMNQFAAAQKDEVHCVTVWRFYGHNSAVRLDGQVGSTREQTMTALIMPLRMNKDVAKQTGAELEPLITPESKIAELEAEIGRLREELSQALGT